MDDLVILCYDQMRSNYAALSLEETKYFLHPKCKLAPIENPGLSYFVSLLFQLKVTCTYNPGEIDGLELRSSILHPIMTRSNKFGSPFLVVKDRPTIIDTKPFPSRRQILSLFVSVFN